MHDLSEADIQVLIALGELEATQRPATAAGLAEGKGYFRKAALDWTDALAGLASAGLLEHAGHTYRLTGEGAAYASRLRRERPRVWYFYNDYYQATRDSKAYAAFCERVFGRNFAQHGFSDMAQLDKLIEIGRLAPGQRVLDLGCGNGAMAEHIASTTGAHVTGIDYIPAAIAQAQERALDNGLLDFHVMDMDALAFAPASFDTIISIDTFYFVENTALVRRLRDLLVPGGQMLIFFAHGAHGPDKDSFDKQTLAPDQTPLGRALAASGLPFRTWDFTRADYAHALLKRTVIEELRADLQCEGNLFLHDNRLAEANGVIAAVEAGLHARYLYHVVVP
jgi:SAM-dependent methyltransferase